MKKLLLVIAISFFAFSSMADTKEGHSTLNGAYEETVGSADSCGLGPAPKYCSEAYKEWTRKKCYCDKFETTDLRYVPESACVVTHSCGME